MSLGNTGDETADFLLRQLRLLSRIGSQAQRQAVPKWERVVRENAEPEAMAASFATGRDEQQPEGSTE